MYEQVTMHHTFYKAGHMEMIYGRKAEKGVREEGERGGGKMPEHLLINILFGTYM